MWPFRRGKKLIDGRKYILKPPRLGWRQPVYDREADLIRKVRRQLVVLLTTDPKYDDIGFHLINLRDEVTDCCAPRVRVILHLDHWSLLCILDPHVLLCAYSVPNYLACRLDIDVQQLRAEVRQYHINKHERHQARKGRQ